MKKTVKKNTNVEIGNTKITKQKKIQKDEENAN